MVKLRTTIVLVTVLLFVYNALFTYIIIQLTTGYSQFVFLVLLAMDYIIIFYFILQIAHEMKFTKVTGKKGRK